MLNPITIGIIVAVMAGVVLLFQAVRILPEYERGVVFRLGRLQDRDYGPGLFFLIPIADRMVRVSLRTVVHDVPPQDVITRDNVSIKVNAVVYFRVMNPSKAINDVENYQYATSQLAQTTLRSVLGQVELDDLLSGRERINHDLQTILDRQTDPWGIKVSSVEVKHVDLPAEMQRAMAKQAEAEREKRAKVIHAQGESQAAAKLAEAAVELSQDPGAMQLRYLQTLTEIAAERNSTLIFPLPVELFRHFLGDGGRRPKSPDLRRLDKKPAVATGDPQIESDAELIRALLAAFHKLELADLLQVLLDTTGAWTGASVGFALGSTGERRGFVTLARSIPDEDPRAASLTKGDPPRLRKWLSAGDRLFDGFGPFGALVHGWPTEQPGWTLALPAAGPDDIWGGLLLLLYDERPDSAAIERCERLFEMARPAVANALHVLAMRELVIKDDTASCFNRRHFEEFLPEELSRANRFRSPVSLIFLDMDNLKEVNNRHGHSMGSRTLYEVSMRVRGKIRKFDKLFRFGGDEFCIVLPETEWHGAMEVAERVRDAVSRKPFLIRELGDGNGVPMTASLGIASFPLHAREQQSLIQQADRAMQKIKRADKNGVGIAEIAGGENDS